MPVADFFTLSSSIGITSAERAEFVAYLELLSRQSDVLEKLKSEDNLYAIRLLTSNNLRIIVCALPRQRWIVLLHAFKEKKRRDYDRATQTARTRRDLVRTDPVTHIAR